MNTNTGRIDWAGLVTFSGALFLLVFALVRGTAEGWGSQYKEGPLPLSNSMFVSPSSLGVFFFRRFSSLRDSFNHAE